MNSSGFLVAVLVLGIAGCSRPSGLQIVDPIDISMKGEAAEPEAVVYFESGNGEGYKSSKLPETCDLLLPSDIQAIFSQDSNFSDITKDRKNTAPVEHSCLIYFGREDESREERRSRRFHSVRLDVYSDGSFLDAGWGLLQHNWEYRSGSSDNQFFLLDDVKASWVDSEHPPDQSLLIHMGGYMLELGYWPPSSFRGSPEANESIERLARLVVERNRSPDL